MAYTRQLWADNDTSKPVSAARMTHIEDGLVNLDGSVASVKLAYRKTRTRAVWGLGDSLTAGAGPGGGGLTTDSTVFPTSLQGAQQFQGGSWIPWAMLASQCRWTFAGYAATGGYTAAQILATHVPQILGAASPGDTVVVLAGTNGNVLADVKTIHTTLRDAGLNTVAVTIPPSSASTIASVDAFNAGLRVFASLNSIPIVEAHSPLADPATGAYLSAINGDGVHPNQAGFQIMGVAIATVLNTLWESAVILVDHNAASTGQLQTNPLAQSALTSGTDYNFLVAGGTSTIAQGTDSEFRGGKCYLFTRGDTNIDAQFKAETLVAGHRYRLGFAIKANASAAWGIRWESNTTGGKILFGFGYPGAYVTAQSTGRFYVEFTCPTLPDYGYRPRIAVNNAGAVVSVGEFTMQDLTLMGAA